MTDSRDGTPTAKPPARMVKATAPFARRLAGHRWFPLWAVLHHRGRKSGSPYSIPVAVMVTPEAFVIGLPWGPQTNWVQNVLAAGGCTLTWKGEDHQTTDPQLVGSDVAVAAAGPLIRQVLSRREFPGFLQLRRQPSTPAGTLTKPPVMNAEILIRRPVEVVFAAFVEPATTTKFWFSKSTGPLVAGARVEWTWEMFGVSSTVDVLELEPDRRIVMQWSGDDDPPTRVEWNFAETSAHATVVRITETGFTGEADTTTAKALGSTAGFTKVLGSAKVLLEHGVVVPIEDLAPQPTSD
ncbi:nitroreductase family deazaflavin-dependent oxidoreductase [Angustibacter sp. McL0619]|uniref:nitroreductase family deazaflavin-dependent oxidoreductase n=1 Tax=Angustibacter sp. McL0619 TaxID=3415676 RepID=UPI003CF6B1A9